eukprot:CAMPEP_0180220440 /NCGR_PEP_ID=MMETSP0987-20121128/19111_1 /TAXON_ID=697907 /ORGANISM="non described non described, Strain CCMP2293" /LENGTH=60 /DNA_ID=CAMNT_0022181327 /DNA_START=578 /DNA_END=757 /DNA_ORIENTATION=+
MTKSTHRSGKLNPPGLQSKSLLHCFGSFMPMPLPPISPLPSELPCREFAPPTRSGRSSGD